VCVMPKHTAQARPPSHVVTCAPGSPVTWPPYWEEHGAATLFSGARDGTMILWRVERQWDGNLQGEMVHSLSANAGVVAMGVLGDGVSVVVAAQDQTVSLWDTQLARKVRRRGGLGCGVELPRVRFTEGGLIEMREAHTAGVTCLAVLADGCTLATGCPSRPLPPEPAPGPLIWAPPLAGSQDTTIVFWDAKGMLLDNRRRGAPRCPPPRPTQAASHELSLQVPRPAHSQRAHGPRASLGGGERL
jgi:WD40 repeat protein